MRVYSNWFKTVRLEYYVNLVDPAKSKLYSNILGAPQNVGTSHCFLLIPSFLFLPPVSQF